MKTKEQTEQTGRSPAEALPVVFQLITRLAKKSDLF
jgi:hypothetical protein